jgi:molybdopterin-guanine dinucleotide biosynthesis protein A
MIPASELTGVILAGGRSQRMRVQGGPAIDKGLLPLDGVPLVAQAVAALHDQVAMLFISANQNHEQYARYGIVIPDHPRFGSHAGPLAGIASVCEHVVTPWVVVLPVDTVALPHDLVSRLARHALAHEPGLAYAKCGSHEHVLCAIMRTNLGESVQRYLESGGRRVRDWMIRQHARAVEFSGSPTGFMNINTPEDLCNVHFVSPGGATGQG